MALEVATFIEDLVDTNPVGATDDLNQADDHMRLIKSVLQNQFTSLGAAAVTVTAAQLNDVPNKLVSFNGRTAIAAVPAADDYSFDQLSDVDTTTTAPVLGDRLEFDATNWVPVTGPTIEHAHYFGFSSLVGDQVVFGTQAYDTIDGSLADIDNTGGAGTGWELTANEACLVTLCLSVSAEEVSANPNFQVAIGLNTPSTAFPAEGSTRIATDAQADMTDGRGGASCTATILLAATDKLTVFYDLAAGTVSNREANLTVSALRV